MKHFLILFVFGILCQSILARGLNNPVFHDLERRLVSLEARQFSERESLEHRMLQLETQLGTQQEEETPKPKLIAVTREEQPSEDTTFLQRLENMEKRWEKELEEQLAKFSSKYDNLTERFSAIEKYVEERNATLIQITEKLSNLPAKPKSAEVKSDENTIDAPRDQTNYESEQEIDNSEDELSGTSLLSFWN